MIPGGRAALRQGGGLSYPGADDGQGTHAERFMLKHLQLFLVVFDRRDRKTVK
jgi:hypothetical protein